MIGLVIAASGAAVWAYLALARGGFWLGQENDRVMRDALVDVPDGFDWPAVTAVIPARNESAFVGSTVGSLLRQDYRGLLQVVVVDDHSDDDTAGVASLAAAEAGASDRLTVIAAAPLPPGWTGKLWAVTQGLNLANQAGSPAEFILLTDGDVHYDPDAVSALVWNVVKQRRVLSSLMVGLHCQSFVEHMFIPAFVFFFQMLYPFAWVNDAKHRTAAAAGGCMLVRRQSLADAGGIQAIRSELIDDVALSRRMKRQGPIHLALGAMARSLRPCASFAAIRQMVTRTAYAQLNRSGCLLLGVVAAMLLVFVGPVVVAALGAGWTRALGLSAWFVMAALFVPMARRYHVSPAWGIALPVIASIYLLFTVESAVQHWLGRGGVWKGRAQGHAGDASEATGP